MPPDLRAITDVIGVEFVSKEAGYEEQLRDFGVERDLFDGVIENPLPDSFRISVGNLEQFNITLQQIKHQRTISYMITVLATLSITVCT